MTTPRDRESPRVPYSAREDTPLVGGGWSRRQWRTIFAVLANEFATLLGTSVIFAVWPLIVQETYGLSLAQVAAVIAAWPVGSLLVTPMLPLASARMGVKCLVAVGTLVTAASDLLFMEVADWRWMLFCHGLRGASASFGYYALTRYLSAELSIGQMAEFQTHRYSAMYTGTLLGQLVGGVAFVYSYRLPFILSAVIQVASAAVLLLVLGEAMPAAQPPCEVTWLSLAKAANGSTLALLSTFFVLGIALDGVTTNLSLVFDARFRVSEGQVGAMIAALTVCSILANGGAALALRSGTGPSRLTAIVALGAVLVAASLVLYAPLWASHGGARWAEYGGFLALHAAGAAAVGAARYPLLQHHFAPLGDRAVDEYVPAIVMLLLRVVQIAGPALWAPLVTHVGYAAWAAGSAAAILLWLPLGPWLGEPCRPAKGTEGA